MKLEQNMKSVLFSTTSIPDVFFTEYLSMANGDYVKVYIESKSRTKSRKQIEQELIYKKGLSKEIVEKGFETAQMADVSEVILKYMQKKHIDPETCDYEQKQRFFAYMMRKGFQIEELKMVFDLT